MKVALTDGDGSPIALRQAQDASAKNGTATAPENSGRWVYTVTAAVDTGTTVRIAVTAEDRPGSTDTAEEAKAL